MVMVWMNARLRGQAHSLLAKAVRRHEGRAVVVAVLRAVGSVQVQADPDPVLETPREGEVHVLQPALHKTVRGILRGMSRAVERCRV